MTDTQLSGAAYHLQNNTGWDLWLLIWASGNYIASSNGEDQLADSNTYSRREKSPYLPVVSQTHKTIQVFVKSSISGTWNRPVKVIQMERCVFLVCLCQFPYSQRRRHFHIGQRDLFICLWTPSVDFICPPLHTPCCHPVLILFCVQREVFPSLNMPLETQLSCSHIMFVLSNIRNPVSGSWQQALWFLTTPVGLLLMCFMCHILGWENIISDQID